MVYRMLEYYAMLERKYKLPIEQFVIFLGSEKPKMPNTLDNKRVKFNFSLITLSELDYHIFLNLDKPEEIILGILANFKGEDPENALKQIIHRIEETTKGDFSLKRYFNQLRVLAQLRNLELNLKNAMDSIAEYIKEERDVLFLRGLDKGQAIAQEREKNARETELTKFVIYLIREGNKTFEQIADISGATVDFVKSVQRQLSAN